MQKKIYFLLTLLFTAWLIATAILAFCSEPNCAGGWKTIIQPKGFDRFPVPPCDPTPQGIYSYPGVDRQPLLDDYLGRIILLEAENKRLQDEITFWRNTAYELLEVARKAERKLKGDGK